MKFITGTEPFFFDSVNEIINDVKIALLGGQLAQGKKLKEFEDNFSKIIKAKYVLGVNSGGTGLELILKALNIKGKEVIVPTDTFVGSASSVIRSGGKVIFADIDKDTLTLSMESVRSLINRNTVGIMLVYMFGLMPENISELKALCKKHNLYFIEDASHAHGASYRGTMAGNLGDAASFSLYATKVITTGEGGLVTTNRQDIYEKVLQLRNYGRSLRGTEYELASNNYRLAEIPAIIGNHQLKYLKKNIERRNKIAQYYMEELREIQELEFLKPDSKSIHSFWRFPVYVNKSIDRNKLQTEMAHKYGVRITWMYEPLCHLQPLFKAINGHRQGDFPVAEECMKRLICLPTHMGVADNDVEMICKALKKVVYLSR